MVNYLNETIGLSKAECQNFFESFIEIVVEQLKKEEDVKIVNFGIFKIRKKGPRIGRNPKTKEEVMISSRNVVRFKASEFLLNTINSTVTNIDEKS
ncbi:MAG: integration host factor subunit alpha [Rickettsiales bacterium]|nr:integration host factor subunit alpha [Rickettsiales bacterium]